MEDLQKGRTTRHKGEMAVILVLQVICVVRTSLVFAKDAQDLQHCSLLHISLNINSC